MACVLFVSTLAGCDTRSQHVRLQPLIGPTGGEILTVAVTREDGDRLVAPSTFGFHVTDASSSDDRWRVQPGLGLGTAPEDTPVRGLRRDGAQMNYPRNHLLAAIGNEIWVITSVDQLPRLLWSDSNGARWQEVPLPFIAADRADTTDIAPPVQAAEPPRLTTSDGNLFLVTTNDVWQLTGDKDAPDWTSIGLRGLPSVAEGLPPAIRNYLPANQHRSFELITLLTDQLLVYRRTTPDDPWVMTSTLATVDRELIGIPQSDAVYVVAADSIQRTDDQGERWFRFWPENLPRIEVAAVIPDPAVQPPYFLLVGAADGSIWLSRDGATTWKQTRESDIDDRAISGFTMSSNRQTVWASSMGQGVLRSGDAGESWAPQNLGLRATRPFDMTLTETGDVLFASRSGLHRLAGEPDMGNWAPLHERATTAVHVDLQTARVVSGTDSGDLIANVGDTSATTTRRPFPEEKAFEFLPAGLDRMMVGSTAVLSIDSRTEGRRWLAFSRLHGAAASNDSGANWRPLPLTDALESALSTATVTQAFAAGAGTMFLVEESANSRTPALLWRSVDDGESWTTVHAFPRDDGASVTVKLAPPSDSGVLFSAHGSTFSRSVDGGETWDTLRGPWDGRRIIAFALGPQRAALLVDSRRQLEVIVVDDLLDKTPSASRHALEFPENVRTPTAESITRFDLHASRIALAAGAHAWIGAVPERRAAIPRSMALLATVAGSIIVIGIAFLYTRAVVSR